MPDSMINAVYEKSLRDRNARRALSVSVEKMRYVHSYVSPYLREKGEHVLYVGVGHGYDALMALHAGDVQKITGVDPYIQGHGNDQCEYEELNELIRSMGYEHAFKVHHESIEKHLSEGNDSYSTIVCFDVLHHIYETKDRISGSDMAGDAVKLFMDFYDALEGGGYLIIGETQRYGLRQLLTKVGILSGSVRYSLKQQSSEWSRLIERAGFQMIERRVYVPWSLRYVRRIMNNWLGLNTISDRSIMIFRKTSTVFSL